MRSSAGGSSVVHGRRLWLIGGLALALSACRGPRLVESRPGDPAVARGTVETAGRPASKQTIESPIEARLVPAAERFVLGEPIWLRFEAHNRTGSAFSLTTSSMTSAGGRSCDFDLEGLRGRPTLDDHVWLVVAPSPETLDWKWCPR